MVQIIVDKDISVFFHGFKDTQKERTIQIIDNNKIQDQQTQQQVQTIEGIIKHYVNIKTLSHSDMFNVLMKELSNFSDINPSLKYDKQIIDGLNNYYNTPIHSQFGFVLGNFVFPNTEIPYQLSKLPQEITQTEMSQFKLFFQTIKIQEMTKMPLGAEQADECITEHERKVSIKPFGYNYGKHLKKLGANHKKQYFNEEKGQVEKRINSMFFLTLCKLNSALTDLACLKLTISKLQQIYQLKRSLELLSKPNRNVKLFITEQNHWGDVFFGINDKFEGFNYLGKLIDLTLDIIKFILLIQNSVRFIKEPTQLERSFWKMFTPEWMDKIDTNTKELIEQQRKSVALSILNLNEHPSEYNLSGIHHTQMVENYSKQYGSIQNSPNRHELYNREQIKELFSFCGDITHQLDDNPILRFVYGN